MANENQKTPGSQESGQVRSTGKELLDSLKEQLRLEGDFRDILRDSVRELQKSIKHHDTISAKLEVYSNDTINIKQVQNEINNNLIKQGINKLKLNEYTEKLGGLESNQVKIADEYLKSLEERSDLEKDYLSKRASFFTLENEFKKTKKDEFDSVVKYFSALEEQRKLEDYIAKLNKDALDLKNQSLKLSGEEKANVLNKIAAIEQEAGYVQETGKKLQENLDLTKQSLTIDQQQYINSKNSYDQLGDSIRQKEEEISTIQQGLNLDQAAYIQAKKTNELYESNNEKLKKQNEFEEASKKNAGLFGKIVGGLANKFGLAEQVQKDMVQQQKKLAAEALASGKPVGTLSNKFSVAKTGLNSLRKGLVESFKTDPIMRYGAAIGIAGLAYKGLKAGLDMVGNAAAKAGNFLAGMTEDSSTIVRGLTSGISDLAKKIPLVGGLLGGLIDGFAALLDLVIGVDDKIVKAGRQLNMTAAEARAFNRALQDAAFNSNNLFVTSKKLLESQVDLTSQLGTTNILNKEILETNIALKDFAGLEADTRARIAEMAITTEQTSQGTVKGILAQVEGLRKATGIEFQSQQILKEIGSQSGFIALQFSKYPKEMAKTLVTVKSMGLELKQLYSIGDSFLDFESSISKEFEAQLLTGKDINLAKAREAFLNNDLVTAAQEITRQVGSSADFEKMRRIEQESLAQAMGMSVDQLSEMLRQQEILARVGGKQGDSATEQLRLARERFSKEEEIKEALGEQNYQALINASAQEKIAGFIDKIKQSIVDFVERTDIIKKIENFVNMLQDPTVMKGILGKIRDTISTFIKVAGELLADILEVGGHIADTFTPFSSRDYSDEAKIGAAKIREVTAEMSGNVKSLGVETVSIEESVKKDKISSTQAPKQTDDMSMKKAPSITFVDKSQTNIVPIDGKMMAQKNVETYFVDAQGNYYGAQTSGQV